MLTILFWIGLSIAAATGGFVGYMVILYRAAERPVDRAMLWAAAITIVCALVPLAVRLW